MFNTKLWMHYAHEMRRLPEADKDHLAICDKTPDECETCLHLRIQMDKTYTGDKEQ